MAKKITYPELKQELELYVEQRGYRTGLYMHYVPEDIECKVDEVYPLVCKHINDANIMGNTKNMLCWSWKGFCRYLCEKYNVEFHEVDDGKLRFIVHSDGSYEEVS